MANPADTAFRPAPKGTYQGRCNRTACQAPDAVWFNHGMGDKWANPKVMDDCYYCATCGGLINSYAGYAMCVPPTDPTHPWYVNPATGTPLGSYGSDDYQGG